MGNGILLALLIFLSSLSSLSSLAKLSSHDISWSIGGATVLLCLAVHATVPLYRRATVPCWSAWDPLFTLLKACSHEL